MKTVAGMTIGILSFLLALGLLIKRFSDDGVAKRNYLKGVMDERLRVCQLYLDTANHTIPIGDLKDFLEKEIAHCQTELQNFVKE